MNHVIKILRISIFLLVSFWALEGYSQAIISKKFTYGEYEPDLGKIVKTEQYKIGSLEVLPEGSMLNYNMWKVLTMSGHSYFIELEYSSSLKDINLSTIISENDLTELIDSIYEMERAVQVDSKTDASYLESKFILFDNSSFGYFISDGIIKWFIDFDEANDGSIVGIPKIHDTKRALELALSKIDEKKDK